MLKVNGNTFSACGASFTVPDGYYIEPHGEMEYESGLDIYSPDPKIFFNIEISEQEKPEIEYIKAFSSTLYTLQQWLQVSLGKPIVSIKNLAKPQSTVISIIYIIS